MDGSTPLHHASSWSDVELARLLVEHGADAAAKDIRIRNRLTPLHQAPSKGQAEFARLLELEHGHCGKQRNSLSGSTGRGIFCYV